MRVRKKKLQIMPWNNQWQNIVKIIRNLAMVNWITTAKYWFFWPNTVASYLHERKRGGDIIHTKLENKELSCLVETPNRIYNSWLKCVQIGGRERPSMIENKLTHKKELLPLLYTHFKQQLMSVVAEPPFLNTLWEIKNPWIRNKRAWSMCQSSYALLVALAHGVSS